MSVHVGWTVGKTFKKAEWAQVCRDYAQLEQAFPAWIDERRAERHRQASLLMRVGRWMQGGGGLDSPAGHPIFAWNGPVGRVTDEAITVGPPEGFVEDNLRRGRRMEWREVTGWTLQRKKGEGCAKTDCGVPGELLVALLAAINGRFPGRIEMTALETPSAHAAAWAGRVLGIQAPMPGFAAGSAVAETEALGEDAADAGATSDLDAGTVHGGDLPAFLQHAPRRRPWKR